jgi:hypothetical protein
MQRAGHSSLCRFGCHFVGTLDWPADFQQLLAKASDEFGRPAHDLTVRMSLNFIIRC